MTLLETDYKDQECPNDSDGRNLIKFISRQAFFRETASEMFLTFIAKAFRDNLIMSDLRSFQTSDTMVGTYYGDGDKHKQASRWLKCCLKTTSIDYSCVV